MNFLLFLKSFFSILPVYGFPKNCKNFVLFYCIDPIFYKKFEIFEIQNFNKIPSFTISFLFFLAFLAFCFLFHLPKLEQKLQNFLWCFIARVRYFTNDFWKILKVLLKKILICEIFFFLNSEVYYFFYFVIIFDILFLISSICTCQKILELFMLFYFYGLEIL